MATYKEIKGATVQTRDEDPTVNAGTWSSSGNFPGPFYLTGASGGTSTAGWTAAGQLSGSYINESYEFNGTTWGSAVSMNRNTSGYAGGNGPQTAGIVVSGYQNAPSGADIQSCETYNGSSWTSIEDLPAVRKENTTGGTSAAALAAAGASPSANAEYYTYNGSTWTDSGNINTARNVPNAGNGSSTSMLVISGNEPTNTNVESWNGSSWTEIAEVNVGRYRGQAAGADNSATIWFGGSSNPGAAFANTEQWDGTSWTEVGDMGTARKWPGGNGTSSAAWVTGGDSGPGSNNLASTETWLIPSGPHLNEGDIFLSGGTTLKGFGRAAGIPAATWSSGGAVNTARSRFGGATNATQTAGLIFGAGDSPYGQTEEYNGTSWSEQNDLNTGRYISYGGGGTQTACITAGGYNPAGSPVYATVVAEEYNGTSWTEVNDLNEGRLDCATFGTSTGAILVGGGEGPGSPGTVSSVESWDGTSWTETTNIPATNKLPCVGEAFVPPEDLCPDNPVGFVVQDEPSQSCKVVVLLGTDPPAAAANVEVPPPKAESADVGMSLTSVQADPFQFSVAPVSAGAEVVPPKINPAVVIPAPAAPALAVLISVVSVQEEPFQDSTKLLTEPVLTPPITYPAVAVPKPVPLLMLVFRSLTSVQLVPSQDSTT